MFDLQQCVCVCVWGEQGSSIFNSSFSRVWKRVWVSLFKPGRATDPTLNSPSAIGRRRATRGSESAGYDRIHSATVQGFYPSFISALKRTTMPARALPTKVKKKKKHVHFSASSDKVLMASSNEQVTFFSSCISLPSDSPLLCYSATPRSPHPHSAN